MNQSILKVIMLMHFSINLKKFYQIIRSEVLSHALLRVFFQGYNVDEIKGEIYLRKEANKLFGVKFNYGHHKL